jgi:hypothetical protein
VKSHKSEFLSSYLSILMTVGELVHTIEVSEYFLL